MTASAYLARIMARIPRPFIWIILICCLIEAVLLLAPFAGRPRLRDFIDALGGFWSPLMFGAKGLYPGQPLVMFVTYGFLHAGLMHLAMNMLSLLVLVRELAPALGTRRLLLIYAVSQVAAAALFGWMKPMSAVPMIGASGAIFGVAGALFGFALVRLRARGLPLGPLGRSAGVLIGLNLVMTLAMPNIAWQAHLGGALAGFVMGAIYGMAEPKPQRRHQD